MHVDVLHRMALAQDVRALEVMESDLGVADGGRRFGGGQLGDVSTMTPVKPPYSAGAPGPTTWISSSTL